MIKKALAFLSALTIIASFAACGTVDNPETDKTAAAGYSHSAEQSSETVSIPEATESSQENNVYVGRMEQNSLGASLPDSKAKTVRKIVGRCKMDQHSWDNISDYTLVVDGTYYAYDSVSGILTKDDTHAEMLSNADRLALNAAIGIEDDPTTAPSAYLTDKP